MKITGLNKYVFLTLNALLIQGCIHDYPKMATNTGIGEDPTMLSGFIEVNYDLSYQHLFHSIDFSSKAGSDKTHRFVVEVADEDHVLIHDEEIIDSDEFASGRFKRKLSVPLNAKEYSIAVWYDRIDNDGHSYFTNTDLSNIRIVNTSTTDTLAFHCGFARDSLDLRAFAGAKKSIDVTKKLRLDLPGARVQIVATDVQDFISQQKEALNQDEKFTAHLDFRSGVNNTFNIYSSTGYHNGEPFSLSGRMRLPYADYTELTIAQGFFFCSSPAQEASVKLSVKNSALATVSQTDWFNIPVKQGYLTIVKGDFLTHPIDGVFNVNNIWEGEIYYEY